MREFSSQFLDNQPEIECSPFHSSPFQRLYLTNKKPGLVYKPVLGTDETCGLVKYSHLGCNKSGIQ